MEPIETKRKIKPKRICFNFKVDDMTKYVVLLKDIKIDIEKEDIENPF